VFRPKSFPDHVGHRIRPILTIMQTARPEERECGMSEFYQQTTFSEIRFRDVVPAYERLLSLRIDPPASSVRHSVW